HKGGTGEEKFLVDIWNQRENPRRSTWEAEAVAALLCSCDLGFANEGRSAPSIAAPHNSPSIAAYVAPSNSSASIGDAKDLGSGIVEEDGAKSEGCGPGMDEEQGALPKEKTRGRQLRYYRTLADITPKRRRAECFKITQSFKRVRSQQNVSPKVALLKVSSPDPFLPDTWPLSKIERKERVGANWA
ncbi:hypothetical protein U1Q18_002521, partial [Sarracenia purpurea var. burkii]